ncbi:MAG TPA: MFS transporter [Planctomycetota bacterium]|nr:MFS transporter [Planctomycetota bacterium]
MPPPPTTRPGITRGQWLVLIAAFLGWLFDGFEMGLFPLIARPALKDLLDNPAEGTVAAWMGYITASFLVGAAFGGLLFGWLGDRIGRVRAMALSILAYSLFTGSGYFASAPWHLAVFRFVAALGMGGEWALGVALVMECWPERSRVLLAGIIGAAANVGFLLVALIAMWLPITQHDWRFMMLIGVLPAALVFFIRLFVPESERWRAAVAARSAQPLREIFAKGARKNTLLAITFAAVALIGTWGCVEWLPLWAEQLVGKDHPGEKAFVMVLRSTGAVAGCLVAPVLGARLGRRPAFFLLCLVSLLLCSVMFRLVTSYGLGFQVMALLVGAAATSFYGWFPLYLPELFATCVRATGQGLSYNAGRLLAAVGSLGTGALVGCFDGSYPRASASISLVYAIGMVVIWWAPETRGRALPD